MHGLFEVGMILKGINGFFELIGGFLLLLATQQQLSELVIFLTQYEFSEDPSDAFLMAILNFVNHLQIGTKIFGALYLLVHGTLKIFLVYNLLKERLWVFPIALGLMQAFVLYQVYRIGVHHSFGLKIVTGFDLVAIGLIWNEWVSRRKMLITVPRPAC